MSAPTSFRTCESIAVPLGHLVAAMPILGLCDTNETSSEVRTNHS